MLSTYPAPIYAKTLKEERNGGSGLIHHKDSRLKARFLGEIIIGFDQAGRNQINAAASLSLSKMICSPGKNLSLHLMDFCLLHFS